MQERMLDGSYGEPVPYDEAEMKKKLGDPEVDHVEVFKNTPSEMQRRNELFEKSQSANRKKRKAKNKMQGKSRRNNR